MLLAEIAGVVVIFWKKAHGNQINPEIESHGLHPKNMIFWSKQAGFSLQIKKVPTPSKIGP